MLLLHSKLHRKPIVMQKNFFRLLHYYCSEKEMNIRTNSFLNAYYAFCTFIALLISS
jgi:hypothetical protein